MSWPTSIKYSFLSFYGRGYDYAEYREMLLKELKYQDANPIRPRRADRKIAWDSMKSSPEFKWVYAERSNYLWSGYRLYENRITIHPWNGCEGHNGHTEDKIPCIALFSDGRVELSTQDIQGLCVRDIASTILNLNFRYIGDELYVGYRGEAEFLVPMSKKTVTFLKEKDELVLDSSPMREYVWKLNRKRARVALNACKSFLSYYTAMKGLGVVDKLDNTITQKIDKHNWHNEITDHTPELIAAAKSKSGSKQLMLLKYFIQLHDIRRYKRYRSWGSFKIVRPDFYMPRFDTPQELIYFLFRCYDKVPQELGVPIRDKYRRA